MRTVDMRVPATTAREGAEYHVRLIVLSYAATVAITRLYLTLTGFPQIGNSTLHISHLLWGGLALFLSALVMIIYSKRWVYVTGSILAGLGMGLFIDEVGKFITRTNDYFFAPAAPIIYSLFLLIVLLYLETGHRPKRDARSELYRAFAALPDVLDGELGIHERRELRSSLRHIITLNEDPDMTHLAHELLDFVESKSVPMARRRQGWLKRLATRWNEYEEQLVTRRGLKAVLAAGLAAFGLLAIVELIELIPGIATALHLSSPLEHLIAAGRIIGPKSLTFFLSGAALKAVCGLTLLTGAGLLAANRDKMGFRFSYVGLLLWITLVNLIEFYFDQFTTIVPAVAEFALLIILLDYRRWAKRRAYQESA